MFTTYDHGTNQLEILETRYLTPVQAETFWVGTHGALHTFESRMERDDLSESLWCIKLRVVLCISYISSLSDYEWVSPIRPRCSKIDVKSLTLLLENLGGR